MGVGWSSIFFAGCVYHDSCYSVLLPDAPHARICLEELGVVHESDHAALVIRVFWR